jgi:hypothetical protein
MIFHNAYYRSRATGQTHPLRAGQEPGHVRLVLPVVGFPMRYVHLLHAVQPSVGRFRDICAWNRAQAANTWSMRLWGTSWQRTSRSRRVRAPRAAPPPGRPGCRACRRETPRYRGWGLDWWGRHGRCADAHLWTILSSVRVGDTIAAYGLIAVASRTLAPHRQ